MEKILVETIVSVPIEKAWEAWNQPEHIKQWNFAHESWCCPSAENDLQPNGKFSYRMEAKDGSFGFDYKGIFNEIRKPEFLSLTLGDGRQVEVSFERIDGESTKITERFDPEAQNSIDLQRSGWQSILKCYKAYVENMM
jgi:uncharacterized protein YndB with AHSA1/START domain